MSSQRKTYRFPLNRSRFAIPQIYISTYHFAKANAITVISFLLQGKMTL